MKKNFVSSMIGMFILVVVIIMCMGVVPAQAANIEMLDEMTLGAKIVSPDIILNSEHIQIGVEIGATDLHNSDSAKNSFFAMGIVTIKGWSIFNLLK
ncbi:MAG: hypothetical protein JRJ39_00040 [Deltaproteobacteria bacterium]|nr:hypothetical protein [Deltaproteobacteria bacterium]